MRGDGGLREGVPWGVLAISIASSLSFSCMGALIVSRRPANAIGWVFSVIGVTLSLYVAAMVLAEAILGRAELVQWGTLAAWYASWSWFLFLGLVLVALPLLYPTGRPVSPRWSVLLWIAAAATLLGIVGRALQPGPLAAPGYAENPFGNASLEAPAGLLFGIGLTVVLLCTLGASTSLVVRLRRARGVEREQLKWFVFVGALLALTMGLGSVGFAPAQQLFIVPIAALPVATGFAILRQGLFDIDVIIRRTLVYGGASLVLVVLYLGVIALLQVLLRQFTAGSDLAVAGSTLAAAGAFHPVRRRIQMAVDRRFYRTKYDAARTLDAFGVRLGEEVLLEEVCADLLEVVQETVRPTQAGVWLRVRPRRRRDLGTPSGRAPELARSAPLSAV